ncbi:MAG TPA: hypothetical protein DCP20_02075 [Coriobacteriia bacterium]|nr:hypothetical protein [Coriobacteriia bacterium]
MTTVDQYFERLLSEQAPGERADAARDAAPGVRDHLKKHEELPTLDPATLLIGSYKRKTANNPLKDVDILVFVDIDEDDYTPAEILKLLRDALKDYPDSEASLRTQKRSVRITLPDHDIDLDLIPALNHTSDNLKPLRIPDRDADVWIDTNPLRYEELLDELHKKHGGAVKPLMRLFKIWRDQHFINKCPKSYWLEVLTYNAVLGGLARPEDGLPQAFRDLFQAAIDKLGPYADLGLTPPLTDPVLGTDITGDWSVDYWQSFVKALRDYRDIADKAIAEDDDEKSAKQWARVFGDVWPVDEETEQASMKRAILAGTAAVSSAGTLYPQKPANVPTYAVPPTRHFGR